MRFPLHTWVDVTDMEMLSRYLNQKAEKLVLKKLSFEDND